MNECYTTTDIYGYSPLGEDEMQDLAKRYLPLLDPRFVKGVLHKDELVAFVVGMPNPAEGIRKAKGRLFPFGLIKIDRCLSCGSKTRRKRTVFWRRNRVHSRYRSSRCQCRG